MQAEVLRLLDEEYLGSGRNAEARIVAAAHQDLQSEVARRRFREDLFYRLSVVTIEVPPLRERVEDLPTLARRVLAMHAARHERLTPKLEREAEGALALHRWPGNVRELVNVLEHALIVCRGDEIRVGDLPERFRAFPSPETPRRGASHLGLPLTNVERRHIERVLAESPTLEKAAERLGISPTTLWRKRKRYGIEIETLLRPQSRE